MSILTCCMPRRNCNKVDLIEDKGSFERYNVRNISIRLSKRIKDKNAAVTGMGKFRASQKLKRKALEEQQKRVMARAELQLRMKKCQSQPTLRVNNFKPYDA